MKFSSVNEKKAMFDQFWEGAEELGLRTLLQNEDVIEKLMCHTCGTYPKMSGDDLNSMITYEKYGEDQSNKRYRSEDVSQYFESFIFDCEDRKCGQVRVKDILKFITGCSTVPPGGFETNFTVHFTERECFPFASTCTYTLTLPLHLNTYEKFKTVMMESVVSGMGFGMI